MKKAEYGLTGDFIFKEAVEFLKKKIPLKLGNIEKSVMSVRERLLQYQDTQALKCFRNFLMS